jgi:hypothetical protein
LELRVSSTLIKELRGKHTGDQLAQHVLFELHSLGVLPKLMAITCDNASNNDTMLQYLDIIAEDLRKDSDNVLASTSGMCHNQKSVASAKLQSFDYLCARVHG